MSRYIDADKVYALLHSGCGYAIWEEPTIDLVRCGECDAYMTDGYAEGCGFCAYHHSVVQADDYCSYGERKGE